MAYAMYEKPVPRVLPKTNNNEILASRMQWKVCATPCVEVYHTTLHFWGSVHTKMEEKRNTVSKYEGWNFNSGNYLFTTDTK